MEQVEHLELEVTLADYGTISGTFTHNRHGWFCEEANGIPWHYHAWGIQTAKSSPEEAATALLTRAEEED